MLKKIFHYINPIDHLGEKKYPVVFPAAVMIVIYAAIEIGYWLIFHKQVATGSFDVILTLFLVLYFSFRSGIRGGLTVTIISIFFFTYFIVSRPATASVKETATIIATLLTVVYLAIAFLLGWLRQRIDTLLFNERRARLRAEESEKKFKTIADNIPILCWMAKSDGSIFWYNKRFYEYTGKTKKQLEGWGWKSVLDPKEFPHVLKQWKASLKTGEPFEMTFPMKSADGEYRQFLTRGVPTKDEKGQVVHWFGTNTDITEQKRIEQQKDDFIGLVSHELKTPVTTIKIYAQAALKEYTTNPKTTKIITKLNEQVDKLKSIIETMLDTVRMEQGKVTMKEEAFILGEVALPIVASLQDTTDHKLTVDWQTSEYLYGNKEKIDQVFTNLITNAIKYSPKKSEIIVRSEKKNHSIVISVQDFGIGLSREEQKNIFERFYQSSEHRTYPGLGLGLYISAEIIRQHGGKMWVKSEKGKGSTFYFSLPIYNGKPKLKG